MLSDTETQIRIRGNNMICSPFVLLCKNDPEQLLPLEIPASLSASVPHPRQILLLMEYFLLQ